MSFEEGDAHRNYFERFESLVIVLLKKCWMNIRQESISLRQQVFATGSICEKINDLHFHDLRHTFTSRSTYLSVDS